MTLPFFIMLEWLEHSTVCSVMRFSLYTVHGRYILLIDHIPILGIDMELVCTRGFSGETSSHGIYIYIQRFIYIYIFIRKSLHHKQDPLRYRGYKYDLFLHY